MGELNDEERVQQGYGREIYSGREMYEGEWQDGRKHGQGLHSYYSGSVYQAGLGILLFLKVK